LDLFILGFVPLILDLLILGFVPLLLSYFGIRFSSDFLLLGIPATANQWVARVGFSKMFIYLLGQFPK
jgi:hypothetical protein